MMWMLRTRERRSSLGKEKAEMHSREEQLAHGELACPGCLWVGTTRGKKVKERENTLARPKKEKEKCDVFIRR